MSEIRNGDEVLVSKTRPAMKNDERRVRRVEKIPERFVESRVSLALVCERDLPFRKLQVR